MDRFYKWSLIMGLLSISAAASVFMALEAGEFFQGLYSSHGPIPYMGYWAAALAEVFMAVMAGVWLPDIRKNKKEKTHPGNFLFKFLLTLLFLATAGGACLNLLVPVLEKIESQKNNSRIIGVLESQVKDNEKSLSMFVEKRQKLNSIVTIRNQSKTKNELKKSLQSREMVTKLWIEAFFVIFVRCVLQLASLSCVWLAGWVYRRSDEKASETDKPEEVSMPEETTAGRDFDSEKKLCREKPPAGKSGAANVIELTRNPTFRPKRIVEKDALPKNIKALSEALSKKQSRRSPEAEALNKEILSLRRKISNLLKARNHNVSLAEVCGIIGEKEARIKSIINLKAEMEAEGLSRLRHILKKIERLHQSERVESFGY